MFSLIVSADSSAWELGPNLSMLKERFGEYSGYEAESITLVEPETLKVLEGTQALLFYEDCVSGPLGDVVRVGHLHDVRAGKRAVQFRFSELGRCERSAVYEQKHLLRVHDWEFSRTHWAIKDGVLPHEIVSQVLEEPKQYDIVMSFAGEDREYVEQVTAYLKTRGVSVFYDEDERVRLWGKDLGDHLDAVYRMHGRYCVMFISQHYAEKMWTSHERRSAFARAIQQRNEYVLPARFDDSEIPGLRPTVGYVDLRSTEPSELGDLILRKLGRIS